MVMIVGRAAGGEPAEARRQRLSEAAQQTYADPDWLHGLRRAGFSTDEIAGFAGVHHATISYWVAQHHLGEPAEIRRRLSLQARRTYANRQWLGRRLERDQSPAEIAREAGTSVETIYNWIRRLIGLACIRRAARERRQPLRPAIPKIRRYAHQEERLAFGKWLKPRLRRFAFFSPRERAVVETVFGLQGALGTEIALAQRWNISREWVRQIKTRALAKLAARVGAKALAAFPYVRSRARAKTSRRLPRNVPKFLRKLRRRRRRS